MSNRLTFSLASLIVLIAFGLVFAPVSVMAHDNASGDSNSTPRPHTHPLLKTLPAKNAPDTADDLGTEVTPHGAHPKVSTIEAVKSSKDTVTAFKGRDVILLEADGDPLDLTVADPGPGIFKVKVTFDQSLETNASLAHTGDPREVTFRAFVNDTNATVSDIALAATVTVDGDDDDEFTLTITVPESSYEGQSDAKLFPIDVYIDVSRNAVTGLPGRSGGTALNAVGNDAHTSSESMKFTIVSEFDDTAPVETITSDTTDTNKFQITFDEALKPGSFTGPDLAIVGGTVETLTKDTEPDEGFPTGVVESWTLTVTADASYQLAKVALKAKSVEDMSGNKGPATPKDAVVTAVDKIKPAVKFAVKSTTKPPALNNGKAEFTITFTEALGSGDNGLQTHDLTVTGGTVANADLTGPANKTDDSQNPDVYTLAVTPTVADADIVAGANPSLADITVSVDTGSSGPQIQDTAGNDIDLTTAARYEPTGTGTTSATFDRTPPTGDVTLSSGPTNGKLTFRAVFSEPVREATVKVFDRGATANLAIESGDGVKPVGTDGTTYDIRVTSKDLTKPTTLLYPALSANSVLDLAGHPIAEDASATYTPPVSNTPPYFLQAEVDKLTERLELLSNGGGGICVGDALPGVAALTKRLELPLATDKERDELSYALTKSGSAVPDTEQATGFYWLNIDENTRLLLAKSAVIADNGTYTLTVTDQHNATATTSFTVNVKALQSAAVPMNLKAEKVNSAAVTTINDRNRVKLTWDAPTPGASYPTCRPDNTHYTLHTERWDANTDAWVAHGSPMRIDAPTTPANTYTTGEIRNGIYRFQLTANNGVNPDSAKSTNATWLRTGGTQVILADPPAAPVNSTSPPKVNGNSVTLNWLAVPENNQNGAPIYDDVVDASHPDYNMLMRTRSKYYGPGVDDMKDFGGYVVYQIDAVTQQVVARYPAITASSPDTKANTVELLPLSGRTGEYYDHPSVTVSDLANGRYAFRFTAMNIAGESARSLTTPVVTIDVATPTTPPTTPPIVGTGVPLATATYEATTGITNISAGTVAANGFIVVQSTALPNLELFFAQGGTITLMDPANAAAKSVVISEILWGLDFGEPVTSQTKHQFIELYNTNISGAINLAGWKLAFQSGRPAPANDVDQVSNTAGTGWVVNVGQSGRIAGTTLFGGTVAPTELVSMYRKIDFNKVQNAGDAKRLEGVPGGNGAGAWAASTRVTSQLSIKSSPGRQPFKAVTVITATSVSRTPFVINEIGNDTGGTNDWIELRNVSDAEASLKNYQMSVVTSDKKDTQLFHFHDKDYKVPAKGVILVASTNPENTDIAAGKDVGRDVKDQELTGVQSRYVVRSFNLPDSGKTLLILRNNHESKHLTTDAHIVDVVGTLSIKDTARATSLWPLKATGAPHGNVVDGTDDEDFRAGKVYQRNNAGGGWGEKHLAVRGYTGIGYDRVATKSAVNGGTPGYDNGALKEKIADLSDAEVSVSEIMLDVGMGRQNLPQWIELYNSSMTHGVNLNGWKLSIENADDVDTELHATITLGAYTIAPNQTVLIVTTSGRVSDVDHFPSTRVINLWTTKAHRDALFLNEGRNAQVFSATGFYFELVDKDNKLVDEGGNLDGSRRTRDEVKWAFPASTEDDRRSSLIRVYSRGDAADGMMADGWRSAQMTNLAYTVSETYYGDPDDFGTPGFRAGGPLPVSLSKFRPERLDDGSIVVRWITESELNNAGFNILRSETKDGVYTKLNTKLIQGQGTTSARTTYTHVDTSAKPNVVYYYQIQDVSLDGKVNTLRVSRLKGHISAADKLTTTWGELKALQ